VPDAMSTKIKNALFALVVLLCFAAPPIGAYFLVEQVQLQPGETLCAGRSHSPSDYQNIIFVAELPNVPKLASHQGNNYLNLGFMYRTAGKNAFVLYLNGARCGEIVDPVTLARMIGTNQFDSAFVVPENPNSYWLQALWIVAALAFGALSFGLMLFYVSLSDKYPGRWAGPILFIPDDPYAIQREVKKLLRIEQNKNVS
jgi:hypothetical protein